MKFKWIVSTIALAMVVNVTAISSAEADYPKKPIILINGAGVGGGLDTYARVLASVAPIILKGQPMVVVNKPGGGHVVALKYIKKAKNDGYTLGAVSAGSAVLASKLRKVGINVFKDFEIIAGYGRFVYALYVNNKSKLKTPQQVVAAAKKNPGKMRFGHSGRGTGTHVAFLAWMYKNGIKLQDVPFKGGGHSRAALIAQQIDLVSTGTQQWKGFEDKISAIGVFQAERDKIRKKIPTMKEQGLPFVDVYSPVMVFAPKGTPKPILKQVEKAVKKATKNKAFKKLSKAASLYIGFLTGKECVALLKDLQQQWNPVIKKIKAARKKK